MLSQHWQQAMAREHQKAASFTSSGRATATARGHKWVSDLQLKFLQEILVVTASAIHTLFRHANHLVTQNGHHQNGWEDCDRQSRFLHPKPAKKDQRALSSCRLRELAKKMETNSDGEKETKKKKKMQPTNSSDPERRNLQI